MKPIVVYFSFTGNNKILANHLAEVLQAPVIEVSEPKKRASFKIIFDLLFDRTPIINPIPVNLQGYDPVIFIAPIWNYRIAHPMKTLLKQAGPKLANYYFVTLCQGRPTQPERIQKQLRSYTQKPPKYLLELYLTDLVPPETKNKGAATMGYKFQPEELQTFQPQIKQFINHIMSTKLLT